MRTTHWIIGQLSGFIALVMIINWLDFGEVLLDTFILAKFRMCFFKVKHSIGHISGMVGPIDVKRKGSASVWYWVQYVTLTFDLTHGLDLGRFKVKFRNSSISGIVGLIDVKWKRSELIWYWADCMTLPHPRPWPWSWNFKVRVWNSFISGMGRPIEMGRKWYESFIQNHDID